MTGRFADHWRSPPLRLMLVCSALFAGGLFLMLLMVYSQATRYIDRRVDHVLELHLAALRQAPSAQLPQAIRELLTRDARRIDFVGLFDPQGRPLAGNVRHLPAGLPRDGQSRMVRLDVAGPVPEPLGAAQEGEAPPIYRARLWTRADGSTLLVGRDLSELSEIRSILLDNLVRGGLAILVLGLACGVGLRVGTLRRVHQMRARIALIMRGELGIRLPRDGRRDDLDQLAGAVNQMLDEIERLVGEVKSVTDTVAHDLRTPLARLRLQLSKARPLATDAAQAQVFDRALEETDALLGRFHALLRIAEIENDLRKAGFKSLSLEALGQEVRELFEPLAEERQIQLGFEPAREPLPAVWGDPDLLLEALSNLVDNALKFTPAGGQVRLWLASEGGLPTVHLSDTGPGIDVGERERVFTRFYRGRGVGTAGHGLGLACVEAILRLHGFRLDWVAAERGTHLRIRMAPPA